MHTAELYSTRSSINQGYGSDDCDTSDSDTSGGSHWWTALSLSLTKSSTDGSWWDNNLAFKSSPGTKALWCWASGLHTPLHPDWFDVWQHWFHHLAAPSVDLCKDHFPTKLLIRRPSYSSQEHHNSAWFIGYINQEKDKRSCSDISQHCLSPHWTISSKSWGIDWPISKAIWDRKQPQGIAW